jgi:glycine/D-amino acid oxidase-like deaminating enzyme
MGERRSEYDIVVIGGGPAGATCALRSARQGLSVVLLERDEHPRFHIGESFLPRNLTLLRELGLLDRMQELPNVPKFGASFAMGADQGSTDFWFSPGPNGEEAFSFNIERAPFDAMLIDAAREAGVTLLEKTSVTSIDRLAEGSVTINTTAGRISARVLLDASGQGTVVGRHLKTRQTLPDLCRVAYFQHYSGVQRREGKIGGHPIIVMCEDGWFWMIPLDEHRTSIGLVMEHGVGKSTGVSPQQMLAWGIARCPFVRDRKPRVRGLQLYLPAVRRTGILPGGRCRYVHRSHLLDRRVYGNDVRSEGRGCCGQAPERACECGRYTSGVPRVHRRVVIGLLQPCAAVLRAWIPGDVPQRHRPLEGPQGDSVCACRACLPAPGFRAQVEAQAIRDDAARA